ncbi:unnamed protein product [Acanthoscelides obtectus]|uniref:Endonuclease/exonuclease/phosphatase domain-containing protein n=1 Tax=Acanthoscelides obtectus TaxID=200917 RepID=A0A9P0Q8S3_ACAOB|nr:unnamed protein product [Acanthoscelides obtectus]CAK1624332.1 hypothetical protein AOBTE_LOCUS2503 [Acanthoscelides obtectus]
MTSEEHETADNRKSQECNVFADKLRIFNRNIQSLFNKMNRLEYFLDDNSIDVLLVSEHWLDNDLIQNLGLGSFSLVSCFARTNRKPGGTAIFSRGNELHLCAPIQYSLSLEMVIEVSAVSFMKIYCIICIYRPPQPNKSSIDIFLERLFSIVSFATSNFKYVILAGDLNIDYSGNDILKDYYAICLDHLSLSLI